MGVRIRMALLPSAPGGSENGLRVFQQDPWKDTQDQNDEGRRGGGFKRIKGRAAGQGRRTRGTAGPAILHARQAGPETGRRTDFRTDSLARRRLQINNETERAHTERTEDRAADAAPPVAEDTDSVDAPPPFDAWNAGAVLVLTSSSLVFPGRVRPNWGTGQSLSLKYRRHSRSRTHGRNRNAAQQLCLRPEQGRSLPGPGTATDGPVLMRAKL